MSRQIEFRDDHLSVHFTGLTSVASLKRELNIPYSAINSVSTELTADQKHVWRMMGTHVGQVHEGHFLHGLDWYFMSFEHEHQIIVLDVDGWQLDDEKKKYKLVALGVENPEAMKAEIEKRL